MTQLRAGIWNHTFDGYHLTTSTPLEMIPHVQDAGIRWNVESFGVERIEVVAPAYGRYDVVRRMNKHAGKRLALFDKYTYRPISGFIVDISPISDYQVKYSAVGPGWRTYDKYGPSDASYDETTTTTEIIENILDDDTYIIGSDFSGLDETSTALGGWQHTQYKGDYPGDMIKQFLKMGSSAGALWDFYIQDEPMAGGLLKVFKPYLKDRAARTTVDWEVCRADLVNLGLNSSVRDYRSSVIVWYGGDQGVATGGSATSLVDSGASFLDGSYSEGDEVWNITDGCKARVREVASNTTLNLSTLSGGSANVFASSDKYAIKRKALFNSNSASTAFSDPFPRQAAEHHEFMDSTQAQQYANALRDQLGYPVQTAAFTIGARTVLNKHIGRVPLSHMIAQGGGIIRIVDLFPDTSAAQNRYSSFFITAMDYGYRANQMRVTIDTRDRRLDAQLKMAGILGSEMIDKGARQYA